VSSVVDYGCFVDVGVGRAGLVHVKFLGGRSLDVAAEVSVGQRVKVRVLSVKGDNLALAMDSTAQSFADIAATRWLDGTVAGAADYGTFVNVFPPDGGRSKQVLVYQSQTNLEGSNLETGQDVRVRVLEADVPGNKLRLSLVAPEPSELGAGQSTLRLVDLSPGQELEGVVAGFSPYGCFVDVGAERKGLVPVRHLGAGATESAEDVLALGARVSVRVLDVGPSYLSLAMDATARAFAPVPSQEWLRAVVRGITDYGVFVDVWPPEGSRSKEGLVQVGELDVSPSSFQKGQEVQVRLLQADVAGDKISLSMRGSSFSGLATLQPGQELSGRVVAFTEYGCFVDVGAERNGLVHMKHLGAGFAERADAVLRAGDPVKVRVLKSSADNLALAMDATAGAFEGCTPMDQLKAVVVRSSDYGACVAVWPPVGGRSKEVLVSANHMDCKPNSLVPGREVKVRVIRVDATNNKLRLELES